MIKVTLSVLGLYFDQNVTTKDNATIFDLMNSAKEQDPSFNFKLAKNGSMAEISYLHLNDFKSFSHKSRKKGLYRIKDEPATNPTIVWQSYIIRNEITKTTNKVFVKSKDSIPLLNGDVVLWRCVAILTGPTA
jgi:hypothetical protein